MLVIAPLHLHSGHARHTVHFVRFATMAIAAELRYRVAVGGRVVIAPNEEYGRVGRTVCRHVSAHAVLIVAGGAGDCVHGCAAEAGQWIAGVLSGRTGWVEIPEGSLIVGQEVGKVGSAVSYDWVIRVATASTGTIPVVPAAAADVGAAAHRVVVAVRCSAGWSCQSEQRGSGASHDWQGLNRLSLHHAYLGYHAVVAAQAEQDNGVGIKRAGDGATGWQCDRIGRRAVSAEVKLRAEQRGHILAPQSVHTVL